MAPAYVTPGNDITYQLTLANLSNKVITDIGVWNPLPANTTYVSGGGFVAGPPAGIEFALASLAANTTHTFTWVAHVGNGVAIGTVIENKDLEIYQYTIDGTKTDTWTISAGTTVEAPGTLVAVYKNASGRPFDVMVDGFSFDNFTNDPPRVSADDLSKADIFALLGPKVCQSGNTAATCVLSGPAQKYLENQIKGMSGGHCDGMATISLRLFDQLPYNGKSAPSDFQPGAANTINLNFPAQLIENYVAHYFITQSYDEIYYDAQYMAGPKEIVNRLTADFNQSPPVAYVLWIEQMPGHKKGHAVTAYGVETVNANESRILIYDNNYPKQRKYLAVDMVENTWRYVTAATPGEEPDIYTGTATTENLSIVRNSARDMPAGQYFTCDFCNSKTSSASVHSAAPGVVEGRIGFQYSGEGAILVVNDENQSTGFAFDTETFINEIPGAQVIYARGGLGKEVPPRIEVPYVEADETLYSVFISGKTIAGVADGSLIMTGAGYAMGLDDVQLDPDELLELVVSPDGDYIAFRASQTMAAPPIYIAYDPVNDEDPSIIFEVDGVILDPGEESSITLDPDLERVYFDDTGALGQEFDVTLTMIWPDGDEETYTETIDVPEGSTSAFIDFGAWDGLLSPSIYVDDVLQNPSVNHRLKLVSSTGSYDPTPQANAPAGVYHVEATFTNVTEVVLNDIYFTVANLAAGNVVLNADGGPAGVGAEILVPAAALGGNGYLDANESFTIGFDVGLASAGSSGLTVDANGEPWDWTPNADPPPSYDANGTSFTFAVRAGYFRFLPMLAR